MVLNSKDGFALRQNMAVFLLESWYNMIYNVRKVKFSFDTDIL